MLHPLRTGSFLTALALLAGVATWWFERRGDGHAPVEVGTAVKDIAPPDWVARSAEVGIRRDERDSGLILKHQVLHMAAVERPKTIGSIGPGKVLVYTSAPELEERLNEVLDGRIPLKRGTEATFALGRLVSAQLVRISADGHVASVEDVRVTFVSFSTN
jgi:hypothetical protein